MGLVPFGTMFGALTFSRSEQLDRGQHRAAGNQDAGDKQGPAGGRFAKGHQHQCRQHEERRSHANLSQETITGGQIHT